LRAERTVQAAKGLKCVNEIFVIGQAKGCTSLDEFFYDDSDAFQDNPADIDLDGMAWLLFSSGTTGTPKAIVHTHRRLTALLESSVKIDHFIPGMKSVFINYMINSGGMAVFLLTTLSHGSINVISAFEEDNLLLTTIDQIKVRTKG
jgi:acyl-coenzyme A synthetase/AMP-(fatty) acid ligase